MNRAAELAAKGAKEICLVGQDLTIYGRDIYGKPCLRELLEELDKVLPSHVWVRLLYLTHRESMKISLIMSPEKNVFFPISTSRFSILTAISSAG